ncbi:MAG: NADH-quinone oxidoreductase subunit C [Candidatus Puniceispirillum sp.]
MTDNDLIEAAEPGLPSLASLADMAEHLGDAGGKPVLSCSVIGDEIEIRVTVADVPQILATIRDDRRAGFTQLIDITAVDYPERASRFDLVYLLLSMRNNMRVRVVASVAEGQAVPSVTSVFMSANWAEREAWDMFGIFFAGHPDLRRLLTDYGFEGHPLRKDFPLTGHVEVRYDDAQRRVVNEPVHLTQEFRDFDFLSPWEGMQREIGKSDKSSDSNNPGE